MSNNHTNGCQNLIHSMKLYFQSTNIIRFPRTDASARHPKHIPIRYYVEKTEVSQLLTDAVPGCIVAFSSYCKIPDEDEFFTEGALSCFTFFPKPIVYVADTWIKA